jgi:hypothetical protein
MVERGFAVLAAAFGFAVAAAGASCSSSSGGSPAAPMDAGVANATEAGAPAFGAGACGKCVASSCAGPVKTCNADPGCAAYLACVDKCPQAAGGNVDPACAAKCPRGTASASTTAEAEIDDCRNTGPGAKCAGCGVDGGGQNPIVNQTCTPMTDQTPCYTCEDDSCCNTYAACHVNPDCTSLETCLKDCYQGVADDAGSPAGGAPDGGSCDIICGGAHMAGLVDWAPRLACLQVKCAVQCENPPMPPLSQCDACINQYCANEYANLNGTPQGYLYGACFAACPSGANPCTAGCIQQYPSASAAGMALAACGNANCPSCN